MLQTRLALLESSGKAEAASAAEREAAAAAQLGDANDCLAHSSALVKENTARTEALTVRRACREAARRPFDWTRPGLRGRAVCARRGGRG